MTFSEGTGLSGGLSKALLLGVARDSMTGTIPETFFVMFQMTFAIITPALIVGAYVERIKFSAVLVFSGLWLILVYAPVAHWVWGGGWLFAARRARLRRRHCGASDGRRLRTGHRLAARAAPGFPDQVRPPHAPWLVMVGASMLWVGWFGFNAGSALSAGANAGMAMLVTHLSAAVASLVWMAIEWRQFGKPSVVGLVTGTIAGLATITPASGYVGPAGGICLGLAGGVLCYLAVQLIRHKASASTIRSTCWRCMASAARRARCSRPFSRRRRWAASVSPKASPSLGQFGVQLIGAIATLVWSAVATFVIVKLTQAVCGLRVSNEQRPKGLDFATHGEKGYNLS